MKPQCANFPFVVTSLVSPIGSSASVSPRLNLKGSVHTLFVHSITNSTVDHFDINLIDSFVCFSFFLFVLFLFSFIFVFFDFVYWFNFFFYYYFLYIYIFLVFVCLLCFWFAFFLFSLFFVMFLFVFGFVWVCVLNDLCFFGCLFAQKSKIGSQNRHLISKWSTFFKIY